MHRRLARRYTSSTGWRRKEYFLIWPKVSLVKKDPSCYYSRSNSKGSSARVSSGEHTVLLCFRSWSVLRRRFPCSKRLGGLRGMPPSDCTCLIREVVILLYIFHVDISYLCSSAFSSKFSHVTELGRGRIGIGDATLGRGAFFSSADEDADHADFCWAPVSSTINCALWREESWPDTCIERVFLMPSTDRLCRGLPKLCTLRLSPEGLLLDIVLAVAVYYLYGTLTFLDFCVKKRAVVGKVQVTVRHAPSK